MSLQMSIHFLQVIHSDFRGPTADMHNKLSFLSSDYVCHMSRLGRCCLVMNSSLGRNLGTFLVLASFLAGIRAEFRCFRSQTTAQGHTGGWRSDRTSTGGNVHSAPAWILANIQLLLRPDVRWEQSHEVRMRARYGQDRVARKGWWSLCSHRHPQLAVPWGCHPCLLFAGQFFQNPLTRGNAMNQTAMLSYINTLLKWCTPCWSHRAATGRFHSVCMGMTQLNVLLSTEVTF